MTSLSIQLNFIAKTLMNDLIFDYNLASASVKVFQRIFLWVVKVKINGKFMREREKNKQKIQSKIICNDSFCFYFNRERWWIAGMLTCSHFSQKLQHSHALTPGALIEILEKVSCKTVISRFLHRFDLNNLLWIEQHTNDVNLFIVECLCVCHINIKS